MGYELQAQTQMLKLLDLVGDSVGDSTLHRATTEIIADRDRWGEAHKQFRFVRRRLLEAEPSTHPMEGGVKHQRETYLHCMLLENCLKTVYNESGVRPPFSAENPDEFDALSPFWVVPSAIHLACELGISLDDVKECL